MPGTSMYTLSPIPADLIHGAVELERTDAGLLPQRLPAWALAQCPDVQLALAAAQPSGVRLAFRTTARVVEALVLMTAPLAPHVAEELWQRLGHGDSLAFAAFPQADPALLVEDTVTCVVQIAGKVRDRLEVAPGVSEAELEALALASPRIQAAIDGKTVRKVIVRAPKLVNIVAN